MERAPGTISIHFKVVDVNFGKVLEERVVHLKENETYWSWRPLDTSIAPDTFRVEASVTRW